VAPAPWAVTTAHRADLAELPAFNPGDAHEPLPAGRAHRRRRYPATASRTPSTRSSRSSG